MFRRLNVLHPRWPFLLIFLLAPIIATNPLNFGATGSGTTQSEGDIKAISDVTLVAVPEPGVLLTLAGGIGTLLGLQRFRRRPTMRRRE
jgi:hypothetical protein